MQNDTRKYQPRAAVLLHKKVLKVFFRYLGLPAPAVNCGRIGTVLERCATVFFSVAFPHGNAIRSEEKVGRYGEILRFLRGEFSLSATR